MPFYVYILHCRDQTYYCGHTDNLEVRMDQHHQGKIGYTARLKPVELIWSAEFNSREEALAVEQQIKGWSRAKKEALMQGDWSQLKELAKNREWASTGSARTGVESTREGKVASPAVLHPAPLSVRVEPFDKLRTGPVETHLKRSESQKPIEP
ncbi:MAG: GIY-YIG nuclease family protein [Burkholderiaceae bacterium]